MKTTERYRAVIEWFSQHMPVAETELHYHDPYQLIVAVILSAQCTDKRVNMVTPALFEAYPSVEALAQALPRRCFPISKAFPTPTTRPNIWWAWPAK